MVGIGVSMWEGGALKYEGGGTLCVRSITGLIECVRVFWKRISSGMRNFECVCVGVCVFCSSRRENNIK